MAVEIPSDASSHSLDKNSDPNLSSDQGDVELSNGQISASGDQEATVYVQGPRFWLITICIVIMMFLTNFEVPVIVTALVSITDDLGGFSIVGWVVASYLLGYVAVIVIFAKFSDIFSRKTVFLLSIMLFIVFSAACAAAQTMIQLIIFRALQGVGGGGSFSLCTILIIELVPPEKTPKFVSNISLSNALALLLGPIIGGAIASNTTWRWIFIINVPLGVPAFLLALFAIPKDFPNHTRPSLEAKNTGVSLGNRLRRIDIPGTVLILFATLALTAAFEEADKKFPWKSAYVITLLTVSGLLWISLIFWERHVTLSNGVREPILPWRFVLNRQMIGILLNFVFLGGPTIIGMFLIPQRFQLAYGTSSLNAGLALIPFGVVIAVGSIFASIVCGKFKVPPLYMMLVGSGLQVLGFALLGTLPATLDIPPRIYGFEVIAGWGCGINFTLLFVVIQFVNEKRDNAVAMGAAAQFRMMGSAMILAISTSVFNTYARPQLESLVGVSDADILPRLLPTLPQELQNQVRYVLAEAYNRQTLVLCASSAMQIPVTLFMWKKKQLTI